MLTFTITNLSTHIDNPEAISKAIGQYLIIRTGTFFKGIDYQIYNETGRTVLKTKHRVDEIKLYNQLSNTFPTGRLGYLLDYCYENQIPYQLIDNRIKPAKHLNLEFVGPECDGSDGNIPRLYQKEAVHKLIAKGGRGVFWHATGSGKTASGARIITTLGVNTLYIVPSLELLEQTVEAFSSFIKGTKIGKIGDGVWDIQPVTVATTATLWSRFETKECKELLGNTELIIADEVHHLSIKSGKTKNKAGKGFAVNSWYIIAANCNAYYRVGLTGTPGKDLESKRGLLEACIGRVIDKVPVKQLIDAGVLSDVEIHMHNIKHPGPYADYPTSRKEGVLLNDPFNRYIVQIAIAELKAGESVLLLTGSKQHQGPALVRIFEEYGYEVPFVSGDSKSKKRTKIKNDFKNGIIKCLVGTVYKEGVDFPALTVGILCDGGRDEKGTCQFLGRVLRTSKGKKIAKLHDFMHKDKKHLQKHSNARLTEYVEQELDKIITHKGIDTWQL